MDVSRPIAFAEHLQLTALGVQPASISFQVSCASKFARRGTEQLFWCFRVSAGADFTRRYCSFHSPQNLTLESDHFICVREQLGEQGDRKSTRLNSSHTVISYAVFCLKKKKDKIKEQQKVAIIK